MGIIIGIVGMGILIWLISVWREIDVRDQASKARGNKARLVAEYEAAQYVNKPIAYDDLIDDFISRERDNDCSTD